MKRRLFTIFSTVPLRKRFAAYLIVLIVGNLILQWFIPVRRGVPLIVNFLVQFLVLGYGLWGLREHMEEKERGRRQRDGCCLTCGYDLKETRERCPECGTVPAKASI